VETRHNTQYLEEALRQISERAGLPVLRAQTNAMEQRARAIGSRRLATAGAIAIAALGIGLGVYLARMRGTGIIGAANPLALSREFYASASVKMR
jgi:hypothetical protein